MCIVNVASENTLMGVIMGSEGEEPLWLKSC